MDFSMKQARKVVALGDSVTYGMSATSQDRCWASRVTKMLEEFCGHPLILENMGIPGNILSVDTPAYAAAAKPAGLERLQQDVIDRKPDILLIAYGLNDSRGGTEPRIFRRDYQKMIDAIQAQIHPLIVCLNLYYMHGQMYKNCAFWEESDYDITEEFNLIIRQLARKNGLLYADVYAAQQGVDWAVCPDHCHPNDLGHLLIANRVFETVVRAIDPEK